MSWYTVTKRINGRFYLYWQKTYRQGGRVKTLNQYIGPVVAKLPPMRSLAAQIADLPEGHRTLRADYDAGRLTKTEYLEAITRKPHVHKYVWQIALEENGNTIKQCECGEVSEIELTANSVARNSDDIPF